MIGNLSSSGGEECTKCEKPMPPKVATMRDVKPVKDRQDVNPNQQQQRDAVRKTEIQNQKDAPVKNVAPANKNQQDQQAPQRQNQANPNDKQHSRHLSKRRLIAREYKNRILSRMRSRQRENPQQATTATTATTAATAATTSERGDKASTAITTTSSAGTCTTKVHKKKKPK